MRPKSVTLLALFAVLASTRAVAVPIDLENEFFIDPDLVVSFDRDTAGIATGVAVAEGDQDPVLLIPPLVSNNPELGDPPIIPALTEDVFLTFDYSFTLGAGEDDIFSVQIFDAFELDGFFLPVEVEVIELAATGGAVVSADAINLTSIATAFAVDVSTELGIDFFLDDFLVADTFSSFSLSNVQIGAAAPPDNGGGGPGPDPSPVPEPSTLFLLLLGIAGLAMARQRA